MLHALVVLAAEAAEEEGSRALFYALGLALAAWAVAISVFGITRADRFPPRLGTRNGVIFVSALLVLGATGSAVLSS
jgi:hypothetical protein